MGELENRCKLAVMVLQELSREISRQKTEKAQEELTMVVCKCHKATQLYCCVHKVPVCGECICRPEHSTCAVRAYSDWIVDGSDILSPKCSLCFQNFSKSSDSVTRLSCLHVLHTSCLLLHLKRSSSPRGYTCPSCNSQIWPPKQQFVSSGSTLYKQIEKVVEKSYITMLDKNFDALSPLASELSPNLSNSSVASGQGISGPAISPRMVVLSSSAPLGELYKNQTAQKLMQQNFILSERNLQTEIDERNSTASAMIDIEASNPSSPEIISTKTVGSPKHKVLSRKCSFRGDKRITDYPTEECGKGSTCIHKEATPKSVMRVMGVKGLTLYHLKSHLQKYRLGKQPHKEVNVETNRDGNPDGGHVSMLARDSSVTANHREAMQIAEALRAQIEVQKRLHEQLEVQRRLQLRIEAQGKYLQAILEKAQQTLASETSTSAGLEATRAKLADLASKVPTDGMNTNLSTLSVPPLMDMPARQDGDQCQVQQKSNIRDCSSQNQFAGLVGKDSLEQSGNESESQNDRRRSRKFFCDGNGGVWGNEDNGSAKLQEFGLNGTSGCSSRAEENLSQTSAERSLMKSVTVERPAARRALADERMPMLVQSNNLPFQECQTDQPEIYSPSMLGNCRKAAEGLDLNMKGEGSVSQQGRELDLNAYGWGR